MSARVTNDQRYSSREDWPCPICGGGADDPRREGVRCIGFVSGGWARCSRITNGRPMADEQTYAHRLIYDCRCGKTHPEPAWWKSRLTKYNYIENDIVVATHMRRDWPMGPKDPMWWVGADGKPGLNGRAPATLPLYGADALGPVPKRIPIVLVEGEKKRDMLMALNIPAVATGTGAPGTHEADVFKILLDYTVILWGDDDEPGRQQRRANAGRLQEIGHANVKELADGTPAPDDYIAANREAEQVLAFLDQAVPIGGARSVGQGLGTFLTESANLPPIEEYIVGLLSSEGSGWIGGEEKLGKSYYMIHEALCLALRLPVLGKFTVPVRRRVLVIEEEDPPRRVRDRVRGLLRGLDLDPDDQAVRDDLDQCFLIQVWGGFTLDDAGWRAKLDQTIQTFKPDVVYLDAVRKVTALNLSKPEDAQTFLDRLDVPRRKYGAIFRVLHHYRKVGGGGGFRSGRGSQEIAGSNKLGAWGEDSLFFEPVTRAGGEVRVTVQRKDGEPPDAFQIVLTDEDGRVILAAKTEQSVALIETQVLGFIGSMPKELATTTGEPGVSIAAMLASGRTTASESVLRRTVRTLQAAKKVAVVGEADKQKKLYGVI
jgi:hypothetical protein